MTGARQTSAKAFAKDVFINQWGTGFGANAIRYRSSGTRKRCRLGIRGGATLSGTVREIKAFGLWGEYVRKDET